MRSGWIEQRQGVKGTSFRARYWIDGPDGSPVAKSKSFGEWSHGGKKAAESAATLYLAKMLTAVVDGTYIQPADITLAALVDQWLSSKEGTISPSTIFSYRAAVRNLPADVGAIAAQRLRPMHLQSLYGRLRADKVGSSVIGILHMVLSAALAQAVKWEVLSRNPAAAVNAPDHTVRPARHWTPEQCAAFLEREGDELRFGVIWRLAILTGMRRGELLALRWTDVDLTARTISISRTITRVKPGVEGIGNTTKTRNSRRTIPLPASCVAPLKAHRLRQLEQRVAASEWSIEGGELIFTTRSGRPYSTSYIGGRFHVAVARAGLPQIPPHGLRHSFATALMLSGVNPKVAADLLGDSVATILKIYSHSTADVREEAVQRFDDLIASLTTGESEVRSATT